MEKSWIWNKLYVYAGLQGCNTHHIEYVMHTIAGAACWVQGCDTYHIEYAMHTLE